jgi:N-acetylneuraminate epimerase
MIMSGLRYRRRVETASRARVYIGALFILILIVPLSAAEPLAWKQLPPVPDARGVAAPFAGVTGGALLVAGGANFPNGLPWEGGTKVWRDRVWLLDRPDGAWRDAGKLPRPLAYGVSVTTPDGIVFVGGSDAERHYAAAFRIVWRNGALTVEPFPALPMPLANAAGVLVGRVLHVACGSEQPGEQAATARAFVLDLSATLPAWREIKPVPGKPRILPVAAAHGDAFFLFGGVALEPDATGRVQRVYLRDAWRYRDREGWKRLSDLPKTLAAAPSPAPVVNGRALLLAGDDGSKFGFQPVEKHPGWPRTILTYDFARDRWSDSGEVPAPRATVPCIAWRGLFVVPNGEVRPGVRSPEVWAMNGAP